MRSNRSASRIEYSTYRQVLYLGVLPLVMGILFLYLSFVLKEREITAYRSSTWRITLIALGCAGALLGYCVLSTYLLARVFAHYGWDYMQRGSRASVAFALLYMLLFVLCIFWPLFGLDRYNDNLEVTALHQRGVWKRVVIDSVDYVPGRGARYDYYFRISGRDGTLHTLNVDRKSNTGLFIGDSLNILYLLSNPTVYREEYDMELDY